MKRAVRGVRRRVGKYSDGKSFSAGMYEGLYMAHRALVTDLCELRRAVRHG